MRVKSRTHAAATPGKTSHHSADTTLQLTLLVSPPHMCGVAVRVRGETVDDVPVRALLKARASVIWSTRRIRTGTYAEPDETIQKGGLDSVCICMRLSKKGLDSIYTALGPLKRVQIGYISSLRSKSDPRVRQLSSESPAIDSSAGLRIRLSSFEHHESA